MSIMSRAAPQSAGSFAALAHWMARFARTVMLHWDRRAAIKSLSELDDRALRDIGLQRCHIEAAVRGERSRRFG